MTTGETVASFLQERSHIEHIGPFKVHTQWSGSSRNKDEQLESNMKHTLTVTKYTYRANEHVSAGREKSIVRPDNAGYHNVHINQGSKVVTLNARTEMRVCHLKQPAEQAYDVFDTTLSDLAYEYGMEDALKDHGYHPIEGMFLAHNSPVDSNWCRSWNGLECVYEYIF